MQRNACAVKHARIMEAGFDTGQRKKHNGNKNRNGGRWDDARLELELNKRARVNTRDRMDDQGSRTHARLRHDMTFKERLNSQPQDSEEKETATDRDGRKESSSSRHQNRQSSFCSLLSHSPWPCCPVPWQTVPCCRRKREGVKERQ